MKIILAAVNAKYSHTNLALRYLTAFCAPEFPGLEALEYNINQDPGLVLSDIARRRPQVVGFSCYIWNIEFVLGLVSDLRRVCPGVTIILGGPEVSFDTEYWLESCPAVDYIIAGEGEKPLLSLLRALKEQGRLSFKARAEIPGLVFRTASGVIQNPVELQDLAEVPPVYLGDLSGLKDKIVYYETTRGCPFRCAYCLSSVMGPVRRFPLERSKQELRRLAAAGLEQVRLVDRTFNYDADRARDLIEFMIGLDTDTRFQLEVNGDILTRPVLELLKSAPENRFQFEIGVQSTYQPTLDAVSRQCDLERLREVVEFLLQKTKVRVLLDLIAGLPHEGFWRFGESFDYVYSLKPHRIHLGFLKLLRGSRLREEAGTFGCVYTERAPYEVLRTADLSFAELRRLKVIEDLVDKYYGLRFENTIAYLLRGGKSPFAFFNRFAEKWEAAGHHWLNHSLMGLYRILQDFFAAGNPDLLCWLRYDFRRTEPRRATPGWMGGIAGRSLENDLIRSGKIAEMLPELRSLERRQISRKIFVEELPFEKGLQTLLFYFPAPDQPAHIFRLG